MDHAVEHVEIPLLIFFIGLFMVIGGVEGSEFLVFLVSSSCLSPNRICWWRRLC